MRRTSICLGVILAFVLLYSNPTFAQHGPSGADGMPSSGEMRAVTNAGGKWESLPNGAGMQATFTNKDGSPTHLSSTQVRNIVQTSYKDPNAPIAPGAADFGGGRGSSDAMGRAVTAFKMQTGNYVPSVNSGAPKPFVVDGNAYKVTVLGVMKKGENPNVGDINKPITFTTPPYGVAGTTIAYVQKQQQAQSQTSYTTTDLLSGKQVPTGVISEYKGPTTGFISTGQSPSKGLRRDGYPGFLPR